MHVVVVGSHGLLGSALIRQLTESGHHVRRLVRRPVVSPAEISWDPHAGRLDPAALSGADAVVNLGGAGLGAHRWSTRYRRTILASRTVPTALLARALASLDDGPRVLLQASAIGYYGERGPQELTEESGPGQGFLVEIVQAWEHATTPAGEAGIRVCHLRTGIVMSRTGGSFGRLLPLLRLGVGGQLGNGKNFWSWITLADHSRAIGHLLDSEVRGPVNLTAPEPKPQGEVIRAVAHALHRPAYVRVPRFALRAVLGAFADDILSSQRALPAALLGDGFEFAHPDLTTAAEWVTRTPRPR